ncbi:MAG: response regulator [Oligoflexus sp.]|nr:response regulator [Oligoflexus sp.]
MFDHLKKVMIVDDSPDFRALFQLLLAQFDLDVISARDGSEAIQYLSKGQVDLIITDFRMPHINGVELLNWCRGCKIFCPVIFTTAEGRLFSAEEIALGDCCATLLKKPIDTKLLNAALEAADRFEHHRDCLHSSFKVEFAKAVGERGVLRSP